MIGPDIFLDRCSASARDALDAVGADANGWSAGIALLTGDGPGSESVRLTRALGFAGADLVGIPHALLHHDSIEVGELVRGLSGRYPDGAGGLELALLALGDRDPLSATAATILMLYGLNRDQVMRAAKAVRVVSLEAIRSAIPQESPDRRSELRMAGLSFHADFGILVLPSSIGIHKLLGRADTLRRQASRDTITSLDLFRASLPFWSDPTIEQLVIGVGVTVELAMAASSRVIEGGTYSRWMCFEPQ